MKFPETARRLTYILNLRKMTAQELANRSGVGKSSISHYVNGSNEPHNKNAGAMARVLNCNPQWLMGFDVKMEPWDEYLKEYKTMEAQIDDAQIHFSMEMEKICATLNEEGRKRLMEYASDLLEMKKYKKDGD